MWVLSCQLSAGSLSTSCIDILNHLEKSCSHITLRQEHQMCTVDHNLRTDVFPTDLNADVTLVTVPIETPARRAVSETEAPAIQSQQWTLFEIHSDLLLLPSWNKIRISWSCSAFFSLATDHKRMLIFLSLTHRMQFLPLGVPESEH